MSGGAEERLVEILRPVSPSPAQRVALEGLLRRGLEFRGKHQARQRHEIAAAELSTDRSNPGWVHPHIVIGEGHDAAAGTDDAGVARHAEAGPRLRDVPDLGKAIGDPSCHA
jgi:hypothetical protein